MDDNWRGGWVSQIPDHREPNGENDRAQEVMLATGAFADFFAAHAFQSRHKRVGGVEEGSLAQLVGTAVFGSALAAGANTQALDALEKLFTRVFKTKAASMERKAGVRLLMKALSDEASEGRELAWINGLEGYNPNPALRLLHEAKRFCEGTHNEKLLTEYQIIFGTALQLLGRFHQLRDAGTIKFAMYDNFADYFHKVEMAINACSQGMKLGFQVHGCVLDYRSLHRVAREAAPQYDMIMLDDPWLQEFRSLSSVGRVKFSQFSNHLMVFCYNRRHRTLLEDRLGGLPRTLTREGLVRAAGAGDILIAEGDLQYPYSIAQQACHCGGMLQPSATDLRSAYAEIRRSKQNIDCRLLTQSDVLCRIGAGGEPFFAPLFLGHAVADSPYREVYEFLPFAEGGVSGNWFIATLERKREAATAIAEIFAAPLDEMAMIAHGIVPARQSLSGLRGSAGLRLLTEKLRVDEGLLYGSNFLRYEGETSFFDVAQDFNATVL